MPGVLSKLFRYREKKSPDKLGLYPEAVDIAAMPERRYLWTSRIMVIVAAISICLTIALASAIFLLLPQRGAHPALYETNRWFSKLELLQKQEQPISVIRLLTEQHIEKYIRLRHEVPQDQSLLYNMWSEESELFWLSSRKVYQDFQGKVQFTQITDFLMKNLTRKVEIEWIKPITNSLWHAQFYTVIRMDKMKEPKVLIWRAYLRVRYEDVPEGNFDYMLNNPFGFKVDLYSLTYAGTPEKPENYMETAKQARAQNYR